MRSRVARGARSADRLAGHRSEAAERTFWQEWDPVVYVDGCRADPVRPPTLGPSPAAISLRLPDGTLGELRVLRVLANERDVPYQSLLSVFPAERLAAQAEAEQTAPVPISTYYVAHAVRETYPGLLIAVAAAVWARYDHERPAALARTLRMLAGHARLTAFRKHPKPPTPKRPKGYAPREEVQRSVATARLLDQHQRPSSP